MKTTIIKISLIFMAIGLIGAGCINAKNKNTSEIQIRDTQEIQIDDLTFSIPSDWIIASNENSFAKFRVTDPKYNVLISFEIKQYPAGSDLNFSPERLLKTTLSNAKIYDEICAPTLGCYYVVYKGKKYLATFLEPQSDEPVPTDIDGVWFPSTTVTEDELWQIILSVK